jgi:hypothetical protein
MRVMGKMKKLGQGLGALALVVCFQNCESPLSSNANLASNEDRSQNAAENGGQPYDGKPFIYVTTCPDGTIVNSRIMINNKDSATLFRENCLTKTPQAIAMQDIRFRSSDVLIYKGKTFNTERPAIPLPGLISWFYQLTGMLQPHPDSIYIIDMFDNTATTIQNLKVQNHTVICTISAGTLENWRPDASLFAPADIGRNVGASSSEKWLDTRSSSVRNLMLARLDLAKQKGCQGIDFDSVDGYENNSGFALSSATQLEYNQYLAFAAHDRELILTLNNVPDLANELSNVFDLAIAEQCFQFGECSKYQAFIQRGKPVLAVEYTAFSSTQCAQAKRDFLSLTFLSQDLDGSRYEPCP